MDPEITSKLLELNRQFYQTFALQFSAARQRLQPGVLRALHRLDLAANILDLGCGNGQLARVLAQQGHDGVYIGLDSSQGLLEQARAIPLPERYKFIQADLATMGWDASIPAGLRFDAALAFAVLHHLPGHSLRRQALLTVCSLLQDQGCLFHSVWQFLYSPRLRARIQPWQAIGLYPAQVDEGDYLLDWRRGGHGLRYVHHFSESELSGLAIEAGFTITESYLSDGEGGRLGLYQEWQLA